MTTTTINSNRSAFAIFRRLGVAGTLFFLVKGLLWLVVPALIAAGR